MKNSIHSLAADQGYIDILPMLDIIFIFFIVIISFVKEIGLNVHSPDQTQSTYHHATSLSMRIVENAQLFHYACNSDSKASESIGLDI